MASIALTFERKSGDHGQLFGSVTSMDIAEALQAKGYEIDRRRIVLKDAIKETGEYVVKVKLHREVTLDVPVTVTAEGGEMPVKEDKKKAKAEEVKAEETAPVAEEAIAEEVVAEEAPTEDEAAT